VNRYQKLGSREDLLSRAVMWGRLARNGIGWKAEDREVIVAATRAAHYARLAATLRPGVPTRRRS
jgi:hypothetical protein